MGRWENVSGMYWLGDEDGGEWKQLFTKEKNDLLGLRVLEWVNKELASWYLSSERMRTWLPSERCCIPGCLLVTYRQPGTVGLWACQLQTFWSFWGMRLTASNQNRGDGCWCSCCEEMILGQSVPASVLVPGHREAQRRSEEGLVEGFSLLMHEEGQLNPYLSWVWRKEIDTQV